MRWLDSITDSMNMTWSKLRETGKTGRSGVGSPWGLKESALYIRWAKYWSFSFSISLSSEYSGLISFRTGRFDLLAVQGTPQESFPAPHFENISFLALSLLYGPTLASTRDYWKNHSFAYRTLNWQNDVSAF